MERCHKAGRTGPAQTLAAACLWWWQGAKDAELGPPWTGSIAVSEDERTEFPDRELGCRLALALASEGPHQARDRGDKGGEGEDEFRGELHLKTPFPYPALLLGRAFSNGVKRG